MGLHMENAAYRTIVEKLASTDLGENMWSSVERNPFEGLPLNEYLKYNLCRSYMKRGPICRNSDSIK